MDLDLRVSSCLRCGNSDFSDDALYCKKCGAPLFNYCTDGNCNRLNVTDAVYCEKCGSRTQFTRAGLLEDPYPPDEPEYDPNNVPF